VIALSSRAGGPDLREVFMREEIKKESANGIVLKDMSLAQKMASMLLACGIAVLLVVIPYLL
jgi:hypothetical protein